jgi:hypothetical protein
MNNNIRNRNNYDYEKGMILNMDEDNQNLMNQLYKNVRNIKDLSTSII